MPELEVSHPLLQLLVPWPLARHYNRLGLLVDSVSFHLDLLRASVLRVSVVPGADVVHVDACVQDVEFTRIVISDVVSEQGV